MAFSGWKTFIPRTTAKSGEVNTNFASIASKPFIVPLAESTTAIASVSYNLTIDVSSVGALLLTDICDLLSLTTNAPIYDTGVIVIGRITDVPSKTVTFYRGVSGVTPIVITDALGIKIIVPVHSTFEDLPVDIFRTEFLDSFTLDYPWFKEDFSSICDGVTTQLSLSYAPVADSITVVRDGVDLFGGASGDYSVNYTTNKIDLVEPPIAGTLLFVKYQYVTGT